MKCENCQADIKENSETCPVCGYSRVINGVDLKKINKAKKIFLFVTKIIKVIYVLPFLLAGLAFLIVGICATINQENTVKNYEKTSGTLINSIRENGQKYYKGIYEYEVNGEIYTVSSNELSKQENFKKTQIVRYNPKNPEKSIIYVNWYPHMIIGSIVSIISILIIMLTIKKKEEGSI